MSNRISFLDGKLSVVLDVYLYKEGDYVTSLSPALDIASQGRSKQEAYDNFKSLIEEVFDDVMERGTLAKLLTKLGWEQKTTLEIGGFNKMKMQTFRRKSAEVPYELLAQESFSANLSC